MVDKVRVIAIGGTIGALVAGSLAAPALFQRAFAEEPAKVVTKTINELFPKPFDPKTLLKFHITTGPDVSLDVKKSATISKISYGHRTYVSIVTTPSGTYSSDALTSPNVRYPGIDVTPKGHGAFSYRSFVGPFGTGTWTSFTEGSLTYLTYSFSPKAGA
jgi:hypothetical protein